MRRTTPFLIAALLICGAIGLTRGGGRGLDAAELQPIDGLGAPGEPVRFRARLLRKSPIGTARGRPGVAVNFFIHGRTIGDAITDSRGDAHYEYEFDRPGHWTIEARTEPIGGRELTAEVLVVVIVPGDRIAIVDVDRAIAVPPSRIALWTRRYAGFRPREGAAEALGWIDSMRHVFYVTDRSDRYARSTRAWLDAHAFPPGPIFYKEWDFYGGDLATYKRTLCRELVTTWSSHPIAIVDSGADARAYRDSGAEAILVGAKNRGVQPNGSPTLRNWGEVVDLLGDG